MKIVKVSYQKAYPIGPFLQEKIGMEIDLTDSDVTPEDAITSASLLCDQWHEAHKPVFQEEQMGTVISDAPFGNPEDDVEAQKIDAALSKAFDEVGKIEYQEDAIAYLNNNGWTFNAQLKKIANSKPKKP